MPLKLRNGISQSEIRNIKMLALAIVVGIIGGLGAVVFRWMISTVNKILFEIPSNLFSDSPIVIILAPTIGGLIVGALIFYLAREAKGHGVPEIIESVNLHDGKMRWRVPFVKIIASAITIGSGGSAGREGPIAQIGGGFASVVASKMNLSKDDSKTLVISGVSAGIAATFNAPLGGVLFGLEIIRRDKKAFNIFPLVISSVIATTVGELFLGTDPAFIFPQYGNYNLIANIPWFILLGALMALFSNFWVRGFYFIEDLFERLHISPILIAGLGGLLIGIMELFIPEVNGISYLAIDNAFALKYTLKTLIIFTVGKLLATSISIGSGGSGGVFAPTLFQGVMLGSVFGLLLKYTSFDVANVDVFALLGMAALFAASARAPLTAVIMTSEMVNDYNLIIPLMFTVITARLIAPLLLKEDVYIIKLERRGVEISPAIDILDDIEVSEVMITEPICVSPKDRVEHVLELMHTTSHTGFPVVDGNIIKGIITSGDVDKLLTAHDVKKWDVGQVCTKKLHAISPECTLAEAFVQFAKYNVNRMPVISDERGTLVGWITRSDIMRMYLRKKSLKIVNEYEINNLENLEDNSENS